jgi:methionine biosynthesis protein MetW
MMRADYEIFLEYIKPGSKVMDIGCGEAEFLFNLKQQKNCRTFGIELAAEKVADAIGKGISVIQGDADHDLASFPSKDVAPDPFDYCILANTLQVMKRPRETLIEAKRISTKVLVSIPNFGFLSQRFYLLFRGKMPVTKQLSYEWYETPNIHFSTTTDFIDLIKNVGLKIEKSYYVDLGGQPKEYIADNPTIANLFGKNAVFILG